MKRIGERLVGKGAKLFKQSQSSPLFSGDPTADALLTDLRRNPHAFVFACIATQQTKAESAWRLPYEMRLRLGGFAMSDLMKVSEAKMVRAFRHPTPLHRFPDVMAKNIHAAVRQIDAAYDGDASAIWAGRPSSAGVVLRFLEFKGVGPKIATMAANILARTFKVPFSDYYSIDVSADVHLRRVFFRLGLIRAEASVEEIVYRARELNPEFPGMMDFPAWEIGRSWCKPKTPLCPACYMNDLCPKVSTVRSKT